MLLRVRLDVLVQCVVLVWYVSEVGGGPLVGGGGGGAVASERHRRHAASGGGGGGAPGEFSPSQDKLDFLRTLQRSLEDVNTDIADEQTNSLLPQPASSSSKRSYGSQSNSLYSNSDQYCEAGAGDPCGNKPDSCCGNMPCLSIYDFRPCPRFSYIRDCVCLF